MILTIEGNQYDIPSHEIEESQTVGMVKTSDGTIAEDDLTRADEQALSSTLNAQFIELQRMRLYVELPDGTVIQAPLIGIQANHIGCHWLFRFVRRSILQAYIVGQARSEYC